MRWRLRNSWGATGSRPQSTLKKIAALEKGLQAWSDERLRRESSALRFRARSGERLQSLMAEAYAIVREASSRVLGLRHYDVQLTGGMHLARRCILEMDTGEGKTLTATLPLFLYALEGKGVHLATANDYLASRDAEELTPLFNFLGLSVGTIVAGLADDERRAAYHCDITYGTANEFGFDLLRDRVKRRQAKLGGADAAETPVGRRFLNAILVDEADKLLIDEATTPLVLAGASPPPAPSEQALYECASEYGPLAKEGLHYVYDKFKQKVDLTKAGRTWARNLPLGSKVTRTSLLDVFLYLERAIKVHRDFHLDKNYMVADGQVLLVDEHTGRVGVGREWHDGIQQAIQAKEGLDVTNPSGTLARVTMQAFFLAYKHLAGMTGTGKESAREFRKIYKCRVLRVEPHRKPQRKQLAATGHWAEAEMFAAVCEETQAALTQGRAVLIGVRSVQASERLSAALLAQGIQHGLLNARHEKTEAEMISKAGKPGQVIVATNMAGRGTDIKLEDSVKAAGGLLVLITQVHETRRIDRQLIGRCGRQGDPGGYRFHVHLTDDILELAHGPDMARGLRAQMQSTNRSKILPLLMAAQRRLSRRSETNRYAMMHQEERRLTTFWRSGIDPLLDLAD